METEKSLVKSSEVKLPAFVESAYQTIEGMKAFAQMLLESRIVPDHFFEKGPDNKPDYTKGKISSVVVVLLQAQQLQVPPMTALQHIVPINGLLSIKGDLAKTMIFNSGKLKKDSWKEVVEGTIENENMVVTITATRWDNGLTLTRSFSVDKAKRMGLWVTAQMLSSQDGWKYKKSGWYKTPDRMVYYRALGFIARDLFSDVLHNMYTTEEAFDIPKDTTEVIDTPDGGQITIQDKEFSKERSGTLTERAMKKIQGEKFKPVEKDGSNIQDATIIDEARKASDYITRPSDGQDPALVGKIIETAENESPFKAEKGSIEYLDGKEVRKDKENSELQEGQFTMKEMEEMDTKVLLEIIKKDTEMIEAMETIPGKNTNKKLREIVYAFQVGKLAEHIAPYLSSEEGGNQGNLEAGTINVTPDGEITEVNAGRDIKPNTNFMNQGSQANTSENKYNMHVPEFDKGQERSFGSMKILFNSMASLKPPIDNPRYLELSDKKEWLEKYSDRESFCRYASVAEVNELVNSN